MHQLPQGNLVTCRNPLGMSQDTIDYSSLVPVALAEFAKQWRRSMDLNPAILIRAGTKNGAPVFGVLRAIMACDFCSAQEIYTTYLADVYEVTAVTVPGIDQISGAGWAACRPCSELIEGDNYGALAERSTKMLLRAYPQLNADRAKVLHVLTAVQHEFRIHRKPSS